MARENVVKLLITPEMDPKAVQDAINQFSEFQKKLQKSRIEWNKISKQTKISVESLADIAKATKEYSKALSSGVQASGKELGKLSDKLNDALDEAEALKKGLKSAQGGSKEEEELGKSFKGVQEKIKGLNNEIENAQKKYKAHGLKVNKVSESYEKLGNAAKFGVMDAIKGIGASFGKGGGPAAIGKGLTDALGKGAAGAATRAGGLGAEGAGPGAAGAMAQAMGTIAKFLPILTAAVGIFAAFWQVLSAASEHMTKLNKAIVAGSATANDFTSDAKSYRGAIDNLRQSSINAAGDLLQYGATSETVAKVINKFAMESTGSLIKTQSTLIDMGGTLDEGVKKFTISAIAYGKALGMEAEEAAGMMGKMVSEIGITAENVQASMENIVKAAATANMPMTKFMGIFRSVLPDVELYQNRLEELTGTIKLLSRTMSPRDVQKFMDAFAKGFKTVDFKQRLKTVLVAGTEFVSESLGKDFDIKAKSLAKNFAKYGVKPDDMVAAMRGGEGEMAKLIAKARGGAAAEGEQLNPADIADAMKLAGYEAARAKGDALSMATALKGAGVYGTYQILSKMGGTLTNGFDGISEQVMTSLGISQEQQEMLRTTSQTLQAQRAELKMYGRTSSKSMNKALEETVKQGKEDMSDAQVQEAMRNATDEQLFQAAELSNKQDAAMDVQEITSNLAAEQVDATLSISDKISNIIAFLLEKLYSVLQPILGLLDDLWSWITGDKDQQKMFARMTDSTNEVAEAFKDLAPERGEQMKLFNQSLQEAVKSGKTGTDLAAAVEKYLPSLEDVSTLSNQEMADIFTAGGLPTDALGEAVNNLKKAIAAGDQKKVMELLSSMPESLSAMEAKLVTHGRGVSEEAVKRAGYAKAGVRPGAEPVEVRKQKKKEEQLAEAAATKVADIDTRVIRQDAAKAKTEEDRNKLLDKAAKIEVKQAEIAKKRAEEEAKKGGAKGAVLAGATAGAPSAIQPPSIFDFKARLKEAMKIGPAPDIEKEGAQKLLGKTFPMLGMFGGGGGASPAAGAPPAAEIAAASTDEQIMEAAVEQVESSGETAKNTRESADSMVDVSGSLRDGIVFKSTFFTKYFKKYRDVTLDVLRIALLEHVILMAAIENSEVRDALTENGKALSEAGVGIDKIVQLPWHGGDWGGPEGRIQKDVLGGKATGGIIPATGSYMMHRGERVMPTTGGGIGGGGGGGGNVYNITINGTDLSPQQLEHAVYGAMDRHARKS